MKYTSALKVKLIYIMRINDDDHKGCLKIGEATECDENVWGLEPNSSALNKAAKARINTYTQTAGIRYDLLYTEVTVYNHNGTLKSFSDHEVHSVLSRSGYKKKFFDTVNKADEWFITDLETAKNAIKAVKEGRESLKADEKSENRNPIIFRPEQQEAIEKTKKQFKKGNEMLWFAKMRFGKTLTALQVAKDLKFKRTIILTHRPVVDAGWFEDFGKIFYDIKDISYGSRNKGDSFITLEKQFKKHNQSYVFFASIQDLRGAELVGGKFDKNQEIFQVPWDFVIVDEAHEGTQTELGKNVLKELVKDNTKTLHLSGTPFNLLENYKDDEIYTWDYVMEQKAKAQWDALHFGDPNPYASLPRLNIFTFDLGKLLKSYGDVELAFNFREFFRTDATTGNFIHKDDVSSFLNLICKKDKENNYPYSTKEFQDNFRHSLWMVPGVKEAKALSSLLQTHTVFSQFKIVNVAGDGDEEEETKEALRKVQSAISDNPQETYTITLSCGRLTTGVSVPAWTAVFMLSGSFNTSASSYMQTIFRVQTPATINGRRKEECFVFDFAPDRTLKVIAEAAKISSKAGKTSSGDRVAMGEFLNFCPIIAMQGSKMATYNVEGMLEQLKKTYVERVVRNGFEDGYLYNNDQLMKLGDVELKDFEKLKKIIGSTKAIPKSGDIDINKQGFTDEEYQKLEGAEKKNRVKAELTEEEKKLLKERTEKRKMRDTAVSILRGISIRMPLLVYGADVTDEEKQIDIDNFSSLIDDHSWEEFMPKGVTKEVFDDFKKYYEPDVFRAAGKRIRAMARAADNLPIEERISRITAIFNTFRNPDKETVLTPWRVVNMHIGECMGGYVFFDDNFEHQTEVPRFVDKGIVTKEVFDEDSCILEINSKSGLYPLYMAYSIYKNIINQDYKSPSYDEQISVWDDVVSENIFVICKTPMAKSITKRTLVGFRSSKVNTRFFEDLINQVTHKKDKFIKQVRLGKTYWKSNREDNMKFNAIVGNPPYQETTDTNFSTPIYHLFFNAAKSLKPRYLSLIHPARFLFNAGATPKEWNEEMLNDKHLSVPLYEPDSQKIFPSVDIKGGICVTFWDEKVDTGGFNGTFIPYKELRTTLKKISNGGFDSIVGPRGETKLNIILDKKYPKDLRIAPNYFDRFPEVFLKSKKSNSDIKIVGLEKGNKRTERYIDSSIINDPKLKKYKVLIPKSNGSGTLGEPLSTPLIGKPNSGCTYSFLQIGAFDKESESHNCLKYIKTKLCRAMLGTLKVTQDNPQSVWKNVPLQDFTKNSDIDWSKSIPEIDKQLYKKYKLTKEEVDFIESKVQPME